MSAERPPTRTGESTPPSVSKPAHRWPKGVSGNPSGRPRIEPRVRRRARRYDARMLRVLVSIAEDPTQPVNERRKAAMDVIAVGSGRPAVIQEVGGREGAPLVSVNIGQGNGPLSPDQAYKLMLDGVLEPDPAHAAFQRPALEAQK